VEPTSPAQSLDVVLGALAVAVTTAVSLGKALEPPALPERLRAVKLVASILGPLGRRGRVVRTRLAAEAVHQYEVLLPVVVEQSLVRLQLTDLVRRYVDLDELVATVDLDAAVKRLDVQAVVERVDLDEVARRLDIEAVLDRMDLTDTVLERVDVEKVVEVCLTRLDLAAIVSGVLDDIDLPEIIRESTGTMASDAVLHARMRGVNADERVTRTAARVFARRSRTKPEEVIRP
jgi:hypothetical protein